MEIFEVMKSRRSIRAYKRDEIPEEMVKILIDSARRAPSAGNVQPWEFVVVRDRRIKRKLARAALNQTFIEEAPVVIVVCADEARARMSYGSRGVNLYCIQDTAAAIENLLLAACALGLGACWVGAFYEDEVKEVLGIPRDVRPVAVIPIGYPAERPHPPPKRSVEEITHYETF